MQLVIKMSPLIFCTLVFISEAEVPNFSCLHACVKCPGLCSHSLPVYKVQSGTNTPVLKLIKVVDNVNAVIVCSLCGGLYTTPNILIIMRFPSFLFYKDDISHARGDCDIKWKHRASVFVMLNTRLLLFV